MTPKTGKPMGRPTDYKPEYCERVIDYFKTHVGFPTIEGFATLAIDVCADTIQEWKKVHPDFSVSCKKAMEIQKHRLCEGAMDGTHNTAFAIFFAKNNCGMKDKVENEISGLDAITIQIVKPRKKRGE